MPYLPSVVEAKHAGVFRIHVTFDDGLQATVDFEEWLIGPVFEPVRAPRYFSRFFIEGGGVAWPNGADIAPETLYEAAQAERSNTPAPDGGCSRETADIQDRKTPPRVSRGR